jgi:hypothetical protein
MGQMFNEQLMIRRLKDTAYRLRQEAIQNGDLETWRIARLIRDASSAEQIREAERRLDRLWNEGA